MSLMQATGAGEPNEVRVTPTATSPTADAISNTGKDEQMAPSLSRFQTAVTALCIAANSLTAGSMFCFPLIGPSLMADLSLSLKQTNTIWVGAVMGEYITAAFWGALADAFGPRPLSAAAAVLFGVGYSLMAHGDATAVKLNRAQQHQRKLAGMVATPYQTSSSLGFVPMTFAFVLVGAGVSASYFSAVTASTRLFPSHPGLAISLPLTLFSLSSLFLTSIGSHFFIDATTGDLSAATFLTFLAVLLTITNGVSTFFMLAPEVKPSQAEGVKKKRVTVQDRAVSMLADERLPLLSTNADSDLEENSGADQARSTANVGASSSSISLVPRSASLRDFLATPSVWILALLMFTAVGGAEMVMSSVGSMVVSLLGGGIVTPSHGATGSAVTSADENSPDLPAMNHEALRWRSMQVQLLATANTLSRLVSGLVTDFLSPSRPKAPPLSDTSDVSATRRILHFVGNIRVSRMTILLTSTTLLTAAFAFSALALSTLHELVGVSLLVGIGYGFTFTQVPSIVANAYGLRTFGRSWGLLTYSCAAGSLGFSLLYAVVSDVVGEDPARQDGTHVPLGVCLHGRSCFQLSFALAATGTAAATLLAVPLWRRWRTYL
ncbi:MFS general substrate transporter [Tilletiaria anomala UBC 951]|uniref:MFS general substrate transporter n=1 Tax=Tilletiaria anomala (strain ATCC 24038 / CBS 436.72 / UBC 951) TaxID=1037660 RepID=A0A066WEP6_TILAU|nr:MFS general substrate transporter [Tilletiaria anomala UBC 951]KDN52397.1 MFS general substrate transporter [Tilletiaria anomala UBC 951]